LVVRAAHEFDEQENAAVNAEEGASLEAEEIALAMGTVVPETEKGADTLIYLGNTAVGPNVEEQMVLEVAISRESGVVEREQQVEQDVDLQVTVPLPLPNSNTFLQVLALRVDCSPNFSRLQDLAQAVST
jgi:hypothetical protein